jgi:hypothetical protein
VGALRNGLVVIAAAVAAGAPAARARDLSRTGFHRPLHLPHVAAGAPCPVSHADASVDFARFGIGTGLGRGPVYPVGMPHGVLFLQKPSGADEGSSWSGAKVLWFVHPRYHGPALIRGRRLDGPGLVRFDDGQVPARALYLHAGWVDRPSSIRLRGRGCFAFQIDGIAFSRVVVFRAVVPDLILKPRVR